MRCRTCGHVQKVRKNRHCWDVSQQCATCHYFGKRGSGGNYKNYEINNG